MLLIIEKIYGENNVAVLSDIAFVATKFDTNALFADFPDLAGRERRMSSNVIKYDFFNDEKSSDNDIMI